MSAPSSGLLVLGMHRSGTSVLARLLNLAGADLGARVSEGGRGNERGHWEDVFAVELHDRLLDAFGLRWSDPFGLPEGWRKSDAAGAARRSIAHYLSSDRRRHPMWVVKDPRLCLFADLWIDAAADVDLPLSAAVVVRHPLQVAHSLQVRDGIGLSPGLALWLDHAVGAFKAGARVSSCLLRHDDLLGHWREALAAVADLPGLDALDPERAKTGAEGFLDADLRHHSDVSGTLPAPIEDVWRLHEEPDPALRGRSAESIVTPVRALLQPLLQDWRSQQRSLWERVGNAEALLSPNAGALLRLPVEIAELRALHQAHHGQLTDAISSEIGVMQQAQVDSVQVAARLQADAAGFGLLSPRLEALESIVQSAQDRLIGAISGEIRNMQEAQSMAMERAALDIRQMGQARAEALEAIVDVQRELARTTAREADAHRELADAADRERNARDELAALQASSAEAASVRLGQRSQEEAQLASLRVELEEEKRCRAILASERERLLGVERQFEQLVRSRSWRLTRPLRALLRALRHGWSSADSARLAHWISRRPSLSRLLPGVFRARLAKAAAAAPDEVRPAVPHHVLAVALAPARDGVADVFVWAVIDWHFRTQRPQHLARALADKGHRVFYVSNNFAPASGSGFSVDALDESGRLFQVHLNLEPAASIYAGMPEAGQVEALLASMAELLSWTCTRQSLSFVQHPFWSRLARSLPNTRIVYDCMDHHSGFDNNAGSIIAAESDLAKSADLVVVTSDWLLDEMRDKARAVALVRNAAEYAFFSKRPDVVFAAPERRRIIGYYGAIAEWFDVELVRKVARAQPDCLVLLVGADTAGAGSSLSDLPNVCLTGEVPYADLPYWLYAFDVCLLPFRVIPLTLATNPVKVYEYLAAGKPVVSVDLPEMTQFGDLVLTAGDHSEFVARVAASLVEAGPDDDSRRRAFAAGQTWVHRAVALDTAVDAIVEPRVSVVVLAYNNLAYTEACLFSIEAYSDYSALEVIVVDNASTDGSREWFAQWEREGSAAGHVRRVILNDSNAGFSGGNNVGLAAATGEVLVILNNDTYVTPGWVRTLCAHLHADPTLGLIGPVTNNIGNEAKIDIAYADMEGMIAAAGAYTRAHPGGETTLDTAAFFCVAMPRKIYEMVGGLDEAFGVGFFEDDDYCRRVSAAGYRVACAEDVFVHHHLSASFDALGAAGKGELFARNKAIYEAKWGMWRPHGYRE